MCILKYLGKQLALITIGGILYGITELLFRGYTHWTMLIVGGLCFALIGLLNEGYNYDMPLIDQMAIAALIVTVVEFAAGLIVNVWLGWAVWDYSDMPFNFLGQICLPFSIAWIFLSIPAILIDDYIRYRVFGEDKPKYIIL